MEQEVAQYGLNGMALHITLKKYGGKGRMNKRWIYCLSLVIAMFVWILGGCSGAGKNTKPQETTEPEITKGIELYRFIEEETGLLKGKSDQFWTQRDVYVLIKNDVPFNAENVSLKVYFVSGDKRELAGENSIKVSPDQQMAITAFRVKRVGTYELEAYAGDSKTPFAVKTARANVYGLVKKK